MRLCESQNGETYKKLECQLHETCVRELIDKVTIDWDAFIIHVNIKHIQSADEFENDNSKTKRILHIDFAINYSCEYQNKVQLDI